MESSCYVFNHSVSYFVLLKAERENLEKKKIEEKKRYKQKPKKYIFYNE